MKTVRSIFSMAMILGLTAGLSAAPLDLTINEVMADPGGFDSNGDGVFSVIQDEYVELYNTTGGALDISNWTVSVDSTVEYTFPASTVLPASGTVVIFGGGTPTGIPGDFIDTASLSLVNGGATVTVEDDSANTIDSVAYPLDDGDNESWTRDPDITGSFVGHVSATGSGGAQGSPGTANDGATALPVELDSFVVE